MGKLWGDDEPTTGTKGDDVNDPGTKLHPDSSDMIGSVCRCGGSNGEHYHGCGRRN